MPYATALRMGDLGYNSDAQKHLNVCYNSLENYVETLHSAIMQPHPDYQGFASGKNGEYQQLNDSLLQIENEFYSPIRPKRVANPGETPLNALARAGIEYIEVRCVDVSPFSPVGLDANRYASWTPSCCTACWKKAHPVMILNRTFKPPISKRSSIVAGSPDCSSTIAPEQFP